MKIYFNTDESQGGVFMPFVEVHENLITPENQFKYLDKYTEKVLVR